MRAPLRVQLGQIATQDFGNELTVAVELAGALRSARTLDRLEPLRLEAVRHQHEADDVRDVAERIAKLRAA